MARKPLETPRTTNDGSRAWQAPAIEWEEPYEPMTFAASCTLQPGNCAGGAQN